VIPSIERIINGFDGRCGWLVLLVVGRVRSWRDPPFGEVAMHL
jgi:hypothetical protein